MSNNQLAIVILTLTAIPLGVLFNLALGYAGFYNEANPISLCQAVIQLSIAIILGLNS